jgi:predicted NBD/HSP70 family sugar kinase
MPKDNLSGNHELMHKINCSLILSSLRKHPRQTRAKLAGRIGLTRSTVSSLADELIEKHFIHEVGYEPSSGGRRGILLELNPNGAAAIAVKINASSVQCALSNLVGEISWHELIPLNSTEPDYVLSIACQLIQTAIDRNHNGPAILGIGVGTTGLVSNEGEVIYSKFLNWEHVDFRKQWESQFGLPVIVDNEVSLAAFGENYYGSATRDSHFIYIEIGYGLGAGIVVDGQLYQGKNGYAGEVGYMVSSQPINGENIQPVSWQSLTNIPKLLQTVERYLEMGEHSELCADALTFDTIIEAAQHNDPVATKALIELSRNVGIGIASLINIFDIPTFIIGGELGKQYEPYLHIIQEEIQCNIIRMPPDGIHVRISTLMPDAALMGAVAQVFDDILKEPSMNVIL